MMNFHSLARELAQHHAVVRTDIDTTRHFPPELFHSLLDDLARRTELIKLESVGISFEERKIRLANIGQGSSSVLLWSQMHGDESTATMAILDILKYLVTQKDSDVVKKIFSSLTLHFLPILNPDGAARCQRRTAQQIDMNRDALALQTPEAVILKNLQQTLTPAFGFNLHDQELSTAGASTELTAIALLAPAFDQQKSENDTRTKAKHVASVFAEVMKPLIPGKVTQYDDSFELRAFGDSMQKWGTSTVLVESGHAMNDPQKEFIRQLNFIGILSSLFAIATGEYASTSLDSYEHLPFNTKKAYDVIVRNVKADHGNGKITNVDLGISSQVDTHSEAPARLLDIGDLSTFTALKEVDGRGKTIPAALLSLSKPFEWKKYFS